jgi:uncharacterized repeat protein (TIGR04138 family)
MIDPTHPLAEVLRRDPRFRVEAYAFVYEALDYAQQQLGMCEARPDGAEGAEVRHVTGQQLCEAIRRFALRQYGPLARFVLNQWGVYASGDFGEIVYNLIEAGRMHKSETDRREDFDDVFDFEEGFRDAFEQKRGEVPF